MAVRAGAALSAYVAALVLAAYAHAIVGGVAPDSPEHRIDPNIAESPWAGVGSLTVGTGGRYTATAIDPWHVITAAHMVRGVPPGNVFLNLNFGGDLTHRIAGAAIHVHPNYDGFTIGAGPVHDDLAIVRLAERLPEDLPIHPVLRLPVAPGTTLTLVGYGASGDGAAGITVGSSATLKRVGRNNADQFVNDNHGSGRREVYVFDFDGPDATSNRIGAPLPGNRTLGNSVEATLAGGDSGSPAFVYTPDGRIFLAGVNTFVSPGGAESGRFGTLGGGMLLSAYADWIDGILAQAPSSGAR